MPRELHRVCILLGLTLVLAASTLADEAYIPSSITGYVQQVYNGSYTYHRFLGIMKYGEYSAAPGVGTEHGFLKFSMDSLPDSITILGADLVYDQYYHSNGLPVVDIRLVRDPTAQPAHDAFFGIENGVPLNSAGPSPDSWVTWHLDSAAGPLLDSCHQAGVACLAIHWSGPPADTFSASAFGYDNGAFPYLHLVYRSAGISQTPSGLALHPEFTLTPNPTRSVSVTINQNSTLAGTLTIRDALGKTARSFPLNASGHTRFDLRGLAPGVYFATLNAAGRPITRKLVVTTR
jgi:hypothetical protein